MQVSLLADRLEELLGEVQRRLGVRLPEPAPADRDNEPLDTPVDEEFRVGAMGLAWDGDAELVVVEAQAAGDEPADESTILEDVEDGPDVLRVRITSAEARAFVDRARRVVVRRPAAVPAVRAAARRRRARLPPAERLPPQLRRLTAARGTGDRRPRSSCRSGAASDAGRSEPARSAPSTLTGPTRST